MGSLILAISVLILALIGYSSITCAGKEDEFPKKPLGQLPPEPPGLANHVANGKLVRKRVEGLPPHGSSPAASVSKQAESGPVTDGTPERYQESRPPSSLDKVPHPDKRERDGRGVDTHKERVPTVLTQNQANHNSNARSSMRRDIAPRWVKPSDGKLEAVKAAALRESQLSLTMGVSPSPSSPTPEEATGAQRRPRSRAFVPGSNRASNASQYDNVPGPDGEVMEIIELEKAPSRPPSRPYVGPSLRQGSPTRPPSDGTAVSHFRMPKQSKPEPRAPLHYPPGMTPVYTTYISDSRSEDRLYGPPYAEQIYATTGRGSSNPSPEKTLMNNSYLTYRRSPPKLASSQGCTCRAFVPDRQCWRGRVLHATTHSSDGLSSLHTHRTALWGAQTERGLVWGHGGGASAISCGTTAISQLPESSALSHSPHSGV